MTLTELLRPPWPGAVFIYAPSTTQQKAALADVRRAVAAVADPQQLEAVEAHPNLLSSDLAGDLLDRFHQRIASGSRTTTSIASTSIFPPNSSDHAPARLIVVPFAHALRATHNTITWSQLFHPPEGYVVVLISSLPFASWRTAEGLEDVSGSAPVAQLYCDDPALGHQRRTREEELLASLPTPAALQSQYGVREEVSSGLGQKHRSLFITWASAAIESELGSWDLDEFMFLLSPVWVAFCKIVQAKAEEEPGKTTFGAFCTQLGRGPAMFALVNPLLRSAMRQLHPRTYSTKAWIERQIAEHYQKVGIDYPSRGSDPDASLSQPQSSLAGRRQLSPTASLLLLSAFLASHLPAKSDARFFLRDEAVLPNFTLSRKGKGRRLRRPVQNNATGEGNDGSSKTNSHPLLLGPKPFPLPRLLAIFQNLAVEFGLFRRGSARRSASRQLLQQRRRKRGHSSGARVSTEMEGQEAAEEALHGVPLNKVLQELIDEKMIVVMTPSAPSIVVVQPTSQSSNPSVATDVLPTAPTRLEWLNHITMRCNCLRDELKELVIGSSGSFIESGDAAAQSLDGNGTLSRSLAREDEDDEDGLNLPRRGGQRSIADAKRKSDHISQLSRREWWSRLEELGL